MARSLAASRQVADSDSEFREIISWYEHLLASTAPPTGLLWQPVLVGPTWRYGPDGWILPEFTLGWRVLAWCGKWLRDKRGQPWQFTSEQTRFVLWYFALDESGGFLNYSAVLQRLKGWGKDPIAACLSMACLLAAVTFDHWDGDVPVGRDEPAAWVQVVAVSLWQTQNTMKLFPSLVSAECKRHYGVQVGKRNVWALGDTRQIEAVTSSPLAIEGGRPTQIIRNETQNWLSGNGGHDMAGAIEGNAAKSEGGAARMLDICNAFRPGQESVGQKVREGWEKTQAVEGERPQAMDFGLMYDSLEAPPEAPLTAEAAPAVIEAVRGDAIWLSTKRVVASITNPSNPESESRRKWYNQIRAVEDAWIEPGEAKDAAVDEQLLPGDEVVLFGDGSKSGDATGLVAVRMSDGFGQVLHVQQPRKGQVVDRDAFDYDVIQAFDTYRPVAFFFDPSHAKDDDAEGDNRFWWPLCDAWMARYGNRLTHWAVKTGDRRHAVVFDMASPAAQALFVPAVEQAQADFEARQIRFAQSQWLIEHCANARNAPGRYGVSIRKEGRDSRRKIDLAVCLVGARMLWRRVQLERVDKKKPRSGRVW